MIGQVAKQTLQSSRTLKTSALAREHLSTLQLVRYDQVTSYAVRSGNWSDPSIWHGGVVPSDGARVLIPVGVEVQVDGMIPARLSTVRVDGSLSFDTAHNTQLQVDTMVVGDCGEFYMGTAATPIASGVTARLLITDNGAINRTWDPFGISRGLITHGHRFDLRLGCCIIHDSVVSTGGGHANPYPFLDTGRLESG